ncbi:MAG: hypothetical protein KME52_03390 [Desmonostoc geniculatum HA4340-LM1]|jgi:hypothetical protein|nr:hypothetical protein [Desmonostoc geniculatum HA4340-LM1]
MPAQLLIEDGSPWWLSTDIWVVPGDDPAATPGLPVAGQNNYLWAQVKNQGDSAVIGARVNFYWSNPATGVLRSNSVIVGAAFVDLGAGEQQDVLCLTPWIPIIVNNGHECVVAEVVHPGDPLPNPLPDPFDPPTYRQVAQRNLIVVPLRFKSLKYFSLPIQVSATARQRKQVVLSVEQVEDSKQTQRLLEQIGLAKLQPARTELVEVGLSTKSMCGEQTDEPIEKDIKLELKTGTARSAYLVVKPIGKSTSGYQLIHVVERTDNQQILGGISFLVYFDEEAA